MYCYQPTLLNLGDLWQQRLAEQLLVAVVVASVAVLVPVEEADAAG